MKRRGSIALLLLVAVIALVYGLDRWRQQAVLQRPQLPVAFEHADHRATPCAECHHNFVDDTGGGACYNCHKLTPDIAADIERQFHDFCRGCHLEARLRGEDAGPLRQCSGCHNGRRPTEQE